MDVICSLGGFAGVGWPRNRFNTFRQVGFSETLLDFNLFNECIVSSKNWDETMAHWRNRLEDYVEEAARQGIKFKIALSPHFENMCRTPNVKKKLDGLLVECINFAAEFGCEDIIVQPLDGEQREECESVNRDFYLSLTDCAKSAGITVLLTNRLRNLNGHYIRGVFSEPAQVAAVIDELNNKAGADIFGFCLDVGICNMVGQNVCGFMAALGSRMKSLFLYENDGVHYNHIMPFFSANSGGSQFDWFNFIRYLRKSGFNGLTVVDFSTTMIALPQPLQPAMLFFAYSLKKYLERQSGVKYLEWQAEVEENIKKYSSRVLFGAGNMSRAYVEHYGEKYPPLYVCDNNPKLWGTKFCGLAVHNPEDLKSLTADCAVIVCNVLYYDDIEHQLREMGVKNPIERFSDEFMPSFQLNRVESHVWKEQVK